jgi:hypothetical protein
MAVDFTTYVRKLGSPVPLLLPNAFAFVFSLFDLEIVTTSSISHARKANTAVIVRRYHIHVHGGRVTVGLHERDGYKRDTTRGKRVHLRQ